MPKPITIYSTVTKPTTPYTSNPGVVGIILDSLEVTLGSLIIYLNGYDTTTPNVISTKPRTAYSEV